MATEKLQWGSELNKYTILYSGGGGDDDGGGGDDGGDGGGDGDDGDPAACSCYLVKTPRCIKTKQATTFSIDQCLFTTK